MQSKFLDSKTEIEFFLIFELNLIFQSPIIINKKMSRQIFPK